MANMNRMPGELSTPPPSPGRQLPGGEFTTGELFSDGTHSKDLEEPKLTISTSPMNSGLASLTCATRLSPDASSPLANRTDPTINTLQSEVMTPELIAVGELVAAMRRVLGTLGTTFDSLGEQTARVVTLAPALKAAEQIKKLRAEIAHIKQEQQMQALEVESLLEEAVKQTLSKDLKEHIQGRVAREVKDRVTHQLNVQIPENLRQQIKSHKRQILEVQRSLHNSEARQHNSALGPAALTEELRPLLRPLPSAEQSPSVVSVLPTPDAMSRDETTPTASPLFPRDLKALFALKSEEAQTLVKEYGLGEQAMPITPIVAEGIVSGEPDLRARNLNKLMAHIGVVGFQMHVFPSCTSSSQEGQSTPSTLIIRVHPSF